MAIQVQCNCPICKNPLPAPVGDTCLICTNSYEFLWNPSPHSFGAEKLDDHSVIVRAEPLCLKPGRTYQSSFDAWGYENRKDLARFAISYGHSGQANFGSKDYEVRVAYIPEILGSGISAHQFTVGPTPCSGILLLSPNSILYGHPYPILDVWVQQKFGTVQKSCLACGCAVSFGHPMCSQCYASIAANDWRKLMVAK